MRFYFHIVTDKGHITDVEGQECTDLAEASREASQSARELMANELLDGRPPPLNWRLDIASGGVTLASISFAEIALGQSRLPVAATKEIIENIRAVMAQTRARRAGLREGLGTAKKELRTLARLNQTLAKMRN